MIDALIADSEAGLDLYASQAFREGRLSGDDVERARREVLGQPDHSRYHLLMALERDAPDTYRAIDTDSRAKVLAGALGHLQYLNDFGYPLPEEDAFDGLAAHALLETGDAARPPLKDLLDDERPAPSRGSESATHSEMHGTRRCDYAKRYLGLLD